MLLIIPHVVVLIFLWIAYVLLTIYVLFVILFTGKYPRGIFDFNVGVLRWTWRVAFYSYSALATDRYPPFSLSTRDYPANLEVEYPERLSQGLVLSSGGCWLSRTISRACWPSSAPWHDSSTGRILQIYPSWS